MCQCQWSSSPPLARAVQLEVRDGSDSDASGATTTTSTAGVTSTRSTARLQLVHQHRHGARVTDIGMANFTGNLNMMNFNLKLKYSSESPVTLLASRWPGTVATPRQDGPDSESDCPSPSRTARVTAGSGSATALPCQCQC